MNQQDVEKELEVLTEQLKILNDKHDKEISNIAERISELEEERLALLAQERLGYRTFMAAYGLYKLNKSFEQLGVVCYGFVDEKGNNISVDNIIATKESYVEFCVDELDCYVTDSGSDFLTRYKGKDPQKCEATFLGYPISRADLAEIIRMVKKD